jgi:hypothetical protein
MSRILFLGFVVLSLARQVLADGELSWARGVVRAVKYVSGKDARETFQLQVVRSDNGSLTGMAVLTREISEKLPGHSPLDVEGVEDDGLFFPLVQAEISDNLDDGWEKIRLAKRAGQTVMRRIEPHTLGESAFVDLSAFRPFIGRKRYGRLVLPGGEAATFFIDNLKPPAKRSGNWERAGLGSDEEIHPTRYEGTFLVPLKEQQVPIALYLTRVEGEGNQVTGYFVYAGARPANDEEKKSQYMDAMLLWATLQVGHDYHKDWRPIGASCSEKEAIKLTSAPAVTLNNCAIRLDGFRSFIGKYRFGQVALPSGAFTIIQLFDLLPPENELIAREVKKD